MVDASVITPFKCYLCEQWKGDKHRSFTMEFADGESVDVCDSENCKPSHRHDGDVRTVVLEKMAGLGMEDDYMSSEGWGYCGRFGNYLLFQDTQGHWESSEYPSVEEAEERYQKLFDIGWGAWEDDAHIYCDRGIYYVTIEGKEIGRVHSGNCPHDNYLRRAKAMVSLEMRKTGYYPNVWLSDDRSMHRIDVW